MSDIVPLEWASLPSRRELHRQIDNLAISAEHKLALTRVSDLATRVGNQMVEVGRRIVAFALELARHFPNLTFAILVAIIINALLVSVPLLGPLLQPLFGPIVLATGIAAGAVAELAEGQMRARVETLIVEFQRIFV